VQKNVAITKNGYTKKYLSKRFENNLLKTQTAGIFRFGIRRGAVWY
jgi:hypothetical protein